MDLTKSIITFLVGVAIFLTGMTMMSGGLKKITGPSLKRMLKKISNNRWAGFTIGVAVTAIIQSSSATSIMTIGFMNAGAMTVFQALSINFGAYIGTTITGLIASLSSFPISDYFVLFAVVGVVLMFFNNDRIKHIGSICAGLGLLFFGLATMKSSLDVNTGSQALLSAVQNFFVLIDFPLLQLLFGVLITLMFQSSSATAGVVIAMVGTNSLTLASANYIILGSTIGTVSTSIIATIGGSIESKRTIIVCLIVRTLSALVGLAIYWPLQDIIDNALLIAFKTPGLAVAMFMVIYSILSMLATLPFTRYYEKMATKLIKDKGEEKIKKAVRFIDNHLINTPSIAMMQVKREIISMMQLAHENFKLGYARLITQNSQNDKEIVDNENKIDYINGAITAFLINLSPMASLKDGKIIGSYFHVINDIERIGDHAFNFYEDSLRMVETDLVFSDIAKEEIVQMYDVVEQMFELSYKIFQRNSKNNLKKLHDLEMRTDELKITLSSRHYDRIQTSLCHIENSGFFTTLISELERVADHLVNVGYSIVNPLGDDEFERAKKKSA
ncbi:MAG: Na/Pi cotransporter family protein [Erysipelotrichia bacterium]|nr:Na/Pi cotransporter family protein [Erysipelotrichia bacterium]